MSHALSGVYKCKKCEWQGTKPDSVQINERDEQGYGTITWKNTCPECGEVVLYVK